VADTATYIVLTAGSMTFVNEWYQTNQINWRVPIATMIAAACFEGISKVDDKAATALAVMVLMVAVTTKFGGKSVVGTVAGIFSSVDSDTAKTTTKKAA
jgi:hypothetical protein